MSHTPTPWRTEFDPTVSGETATIIMQKDAEMWERWIARCEFGQDGDSHLPGDGKRDCTASEAQANARRIVACVNACEGVSTENLHPGDMHRLILDLDEARRQRNQLLAALNGLRYPGGFAGEPDQYCDHAAEPCNRCEAARAAIASVKGE